MRSRTVSGSKALVSGMRFGSGPLSGRDLVFVHGAIGNCFLRWADGRNASERQPQAL
jgi:hypothetical protein